VLESYINDSVVHYIIYLVIGPSTNLEYKILFTINTARVTIRVQPILFFETDTDILKFLTDIFADISTK